jgi:hypothetical protein
MASRAHVAPPGLSTHGISGDKRQTGFKTNAATTRTAPRAWLRRWPGPLVTASLDVVVAVNLGAGIKRDVVAGGEDERHVNRNPDRRPRRKLSSSGRIEQVDPPASPGFAVVER